MRSFQLCQGFEKRDIAFIEPDTEHTAVQALVDAIDGVNHEIPKGLDFWHQSGDLGYSDDWFLNLENSPLTTLLYGGVSRAVSFASRTGHRSYSLTGWSWKPRSGLYSGRVHPGGLLLTSSSQLYRVYCSSFSSFPSPKYTADFLCTGSVDVSRRPCLVATHSRRPTRPRSSCVKRPARSQSRRYGTRTTKVPLTLYKSTQK